MIQLKIKYAEAPVRPFVYLKESIGAEAVKTLLLLAAQIALLAFSRSFSALSVIAAATLASALADVLMREWNKEGRKKFSLLIAINQGIIAGMLVPENYPPATVFAATFASMLLLKHLFGSFAYAWAHPSVFTAVILWFAGVTLFPALGISKEWLTLKNPSQFLIKSGSVPLCRLDGLLTDALNNSLFRLFGTTVPQGYVSLFWDTHSVIPAFRFNCVTLLSSAFVFGSDFMRALIPGVFLFVYLLLVRLVAPFFYGGLWFQGDMLLAALTGGTLFTALFIIGWHGTTPLSLHGQLAYALLGGVAAFLIAGVGASSAGMVFTAIAANCISLPIQKWEGRKDRKELRRMLDAFEGKAERI